MVEEAGESDLPGQDGPEAAVPVSVRPFEERDYRWLKDFDPAPLPAERDSIYLIFALDFPDLCFVAERRGAAEPVGYVLALLSADRAVVHVHALWVAPDERRHGVGRALTERLLTAAREAGAAHVALYTVRARQFYERLGFRRGWPGGSAGLVRHIELERGAICMMRETAADAA